jgi:hypothetical protein
MDPMDRKYRPYYVFLSLAVMTFSVFVYWQRTNSSAGHKVLMIAPIAIGCLVTSIWALIAKTVPAVRCAWVANLGTFVAFEVVRMLHLR